MDRLYDSLISYTGEDYYPMHMPGHKRNIQLLQSVNPYMLDITEIEGFDNLHQAQGVLKYLSQRLCRLYGAGKSYPLVNGSTSGILAGISAAVHRGDKILLARNSHKSAYHALVLRGLVPVYIYPPQIEQLAINGGISASQIDELLIKHEDIRLVVITSPTYEGVVSDITGIADTVHRHGALLMVDEAHGAHFGFHEGFPKSAVAAGADLVVQSLHKTLPAFTQTAVLHSGREELDRKLQDYLAIYQSSSPSYLLMAGMDRCISLLEDRGKELFNIYYDRLMDFYLSLKSLKGLQIADRSLVGRNGVYDLDSSKLTISVRNTGLSGHQLQEILRKQYHIELEMAASDYVLGMTSICDTQEGFDRMAEALLSIDREAIARTTHRITSNNELNRIVPVQVLLPCEVNELETQSVKLKDSAGRISAAFISLFPPGSPLIVPGERLDQEFIRYILRVKQEGITITGLTGEQMDEIEVV